MMKWLIYLWQKNKKDKKKGKNKVMKMFSEL